jgi:hypothetical protein
MKAAVYSRYGAVVICHPGSSRITLELYRRRVLAEEWNRGRDVRARSIKP